MRAAGRCGVIMLMTIVMSTPDVDGVDAAVGALREWQYDGAPAQIHPGDVGWYRRAGVSESAAAVRTWSRDGRIVAVGLLDGEELLRITFAPDARRDEEVATAVVADITDPARGVLGSGKVYVEAPDDALLQERLAALGWGLDEPWTHLRRDLTEPVEECGLRIEVVGPEHVADRTAVQRSAFGSTHFTDERWHLMAGGPAYADARCLVGYDEQDAAVAIVTVWSAGEGRPGLIEPMGVHADHRGHGYGRAICVAAAAALREMGASSALVGTPSANTGAVATYKAAGFTARPEVADRTRDALDV